MSCNNSLCYSGDDSGDRTKLCCGVLNWKTAIILIALGDFISVSIEAYGTSGATLGEVETRLVISHLFNVSMNGKHFNNSSTIDSSTSGTIYYFIYIAGLFLYVLRVLSIFSLVLGSQNYRPCNVLLWIISAPLGWVIFFIMQVALLLRYYGENNQQSKFWTMWNDKDLFDLDPTSFQTKIAEWNPNPSAFGQPWISILIISIVTFIFTLPATVYVTIFYCKQRSNQIH